MCVRLVGDRVGVGKCRVIGVRRGVGKCRGIEV